MRRKVIKKRLKKRTPKKTLARKSRRKPAQRRNADRVLIGAIAEKLSYSGGKGKPPKSRWVHKFEVPVRVWGLADGTVLLEPADKSLNLWDNYDVKV